MFRSFIYFDEDKFYSYKRQLEGKNQVQPRSMLKKRKAEVSASFKGVGFGGETETSIEGDFVKDFAFDYNEFESALAQHEGELYFDIATNSDYDLATIPAMSLVRIFSGFTIPEEFDAINLVDRFKPMLMGQIDVESENEQEALESLLGNASADIPFVIKYDDFTLAGKLATKHLREDYSDLEDCAEQEVYLLCKIVGLIRKDSVNIFDPWKDFISLPRDFRRQMERKGETLAGFDKIVVDGPVLKVEVIAIYR